MGITRDCLDFLWKARSQDSGRGELQHIYFSAERNAVLAIDGYSLHAVKGSDNIECLADLDDRAGSVLVREDPGAMRKRIRDLEKSVRGMKEEAHFMVNPKLLIRTLEAMKSDVGVKVRVMYRDGKPMLLEFGGFVDGTPAYAILMLMHSETMDWNYWYPISPARDDEAAER